MAQALQHTVQVKLHGVVAVSASRVIWLSEQTRGCGVETLSKPTVLGVPCYIPANSQACVCLKQLSPRVMPSTINFHVLIISFYCHQSSSLHPLALTFIAQVLVSRVLLFLWMRR